MAIQKQEFYEGAALHALARTGCITSISYLSPFFLINKHVLVLLKYSTKGRSPWNFTFTADEQKILAGMKGEAELVIGLVCGSDGIAAFEYSSYLKIASPRQTALHISCYRSHGEHYEINGPDGELGVKIPPSKWKKILQS